MMSAEAEPMTMPMGDGEPLPREIDELAEAEDAILVQRAGVPDEERNRRNAHSPRGGRTGRCRGRHIAALRRDAPPHDIACGSILRHLR
jgi:hypothetical protein